MSHLTEGQRYEISALLQAGKSRKEICAIIDKDKSVLSRELRRNCDRRSGKYNACLAQRKYEERLYTKPKRIHFTEEVKTLVINGLKEDFSPEQIAGRAKLEGKDCVSHERIYQFVWQDKKHNGTLFQHLRNKGKKYKKRGNYKSTRGIIKDRVSIHDRPEIVEKRERFGDLEIDTIVGKGNKGAIFTATDRHSMMEWIVKLDGKNADSLAKKVSEKMMNFKDLLHTMTADNGKEFAEHKQIAQLLNINFYFADPYKSCQRGLNENHNRLIRQYIPKKANFENIDNKYVNFVQNKLNNRPRKKIGFLTPNEKFILTLQNQNVAFVT